MENQETINKLRRLYNESTNETAKAGAKAKLEKMGVSLTDDKPKASLSQDAIDKLRRLYNESTNETAKAGAKAKLESAGISLSGEKPKAKAKAKKKAKVEKVDERIIKMVEGWKDENRAFSKLGNDDSDFFKIIKKRMGEVGVTSQTGNDLLYYNTDIYDNDTDAIRKKVSQNAKKVEPKAKATAKDPYDCDDLIKQAKERKAKAKANAIKRANAPKKTAATKNKERVEKATTKVAKNVEVRAKKGEVKVAELEKLIAEYEDAIKKLKALLSKVKSGKKFAKGGNMGMMDSEDSKEYHKIKDHNCGCNDKMAKGGKVDEFGSMSFKNNYDEYEMIVISKELNKDGGRLYKDRFLVSAKNITEAKKIATELWEKDFSDSDLSIEKVMSVEAYNNNPEMRKMARGGKVVVRRTNIASDKKYSALKEGKRTSRKYANVEMRGGRVYHRRNANQYGKVKGGNTYYEYNENRTDKRVYLEKGGNLGLNYVVFDGTSAYVCDKQEMLKITSKDKDCKVVFKSANLDKASDFADNYNDNISGK